MSPRGQQHPWLSYLFSPRLSNQDKGVRLADVPRLRELRHLQSKPQKGTVLGKLFTVPSDSAPGTAKTSSGLSTPSLLHNDTATQASAQHLDPVNEKDVPDFDVATHAQASLCLAFLQQHVRDAGPRAAQAAIHGSDNACEQLLAICATGELICRLINSLVPDTIDDRLVRTPVYPPPQDDHTDGVVAGDGLLLPEAASITVQDNWFDAAASTAADAATATQPASTAAAAAAAEPAAADAEGVSAAAAAPATDASAASAAAATAAASGSAAVQGRVGGGGGGVRNKSASVGDQVAWNWRLAYGSVVSLGCAVEDPPPDSLRDIEVTTIISFILTLARFYFTKDLDIQSVEGLKGLGIAGESESDLACLSLDTVLARWVRHVIASAAKSGTGANTHSEHQPRASHSPPAATPPTGTSPPSDTPPAMQPPNRNNTNNPTSTNQPTNRMSDRGEVKAVTNGSHDSPLDACIGMGALGELLSALVLRASDSCGISNEQVSVDSSGVELEGDENLNLLPTGSGRLEELERLQQLQLAGQLVLQAAQLGVPLQVQARWLVDGGAAVARLLLLAVVRTALLPLSPPASPQHTHTHIQPTLAGLAAPQTHTHTHSQPTFTHLNNTATSSQPHGFRNGHSLGGVDVKGDIGGQREDGGGGVREAGQEGDQEQEQAEPGPSSAFAAALAAAQAASGSAAAAGRRRLSRHSGSGGGRGSKNARADWQRPSQCDDTQGATDSVTDAGSQSACRQGGGAGGGKGGVVAKGMGGGRGEEEVIDRQEEKLLRGWLNSLLAERGLKVSSLFDPAMCTGWPLLVVCDVMAPGAINWAKAYPPPYNGKRVPRKIMAVENGNQVCRVCTQLWNLPLVNIGGIDIAEGHKGALMSLVWQLMRHHMVLVLGPLISQIPPTPPLSPRQSQPGSPESTSPSGPTNTTHTSTATQASTQGAGTQGTGAHSTSVQDLSDGAGVQTPPTSPGGARPSQAVMARMNSRARPFQQIEEEVVRWANAKLRTTVTPSHEDAPWRLSGLTDPLFTNFQVWVSILCAVGGPAAVDPALVLPGNSARERVSNARLVLCTSRALGAKVYLAAEDLADAMPRAVLCLLTALMACEKSAMATRAARAA